MADRRDRSDGRGGRGQHPAPRTIDAADDPIAERARLVADYEERYRESVRRAARGYVDDVIQPRDTRPRLIAALEMLADKRDTNPPKKHGNMPL